MSALATKWTSQFFETLGDDRLAADELREASVRSDLARWTSALTSVVVRSFETLGWAAAGKGHRCTVLPVKRNEYLSQDVMAFSTPGEGWRFPLAVCELENSADADLVAYSLWKVLCVRCGLRVVVCYRPDAADGPAFVASLAGEVIEAMPIAERASLAGETLVIVGSRNDAGTFPYGFFQAWKLNSNTGRFERFARQ
ncbi:hypothetical protein [Chondromyces crocatus]|uniref:Uncharacterized protein n=1 Tax=Chondromyces crocatus TaxID=52 RepID=A0A0K1ENT4_CHOCO|nr:hypothetical protein [Chondromyces crocatus]AKT42521.1 uncharacterized protein CMC5_067470 [Chondromyces crocatus]